MATSGSCVVEIPTDITLSHDDGERFPGEISMVRPQRHSIYRVPEYIKDMTNRDAYRPQVVSLGPFHYGEPPLKPMEAHKQRAVAHMVSRSGKPRQEFTAAVEGIAEQLRGAYENLGEEWSGERFVELMVTDGCFLLEVMKDEVEVQGYGSDDPVFSKHGRLYLYSYIISDMLLVENQLPLLLLQKLTLVADPDTEDDRGINHRVLDLLSYTTTPTAPTTPVDEFLGLHPLDVLQKSVRGTRQYRQRPIGDGHMPSAAELREAGIHFKVSTGEGFAGTVSFERGVLRVPKIFLYDDAERMFLNLMAFEQLRPGAGNEVTAFVSFMDDLINTAKDVRLLRAQGDHRERLGKRRGGGESDQQHADERLGDGRRQQPQRRDVGSGCLLQDAAEQTIFRATYWLRCWAQLQSCDEDGEFMKVACRRLEMTVMQLFANYGWRFTNRLQ
ncbi:hypothetical protein OsJ_34160 [Oryza sativa Japonica Group]|uniref:Uncharacterized protein n=1 Tax=Oryza sativa subsp. japonica TaxID=39947 RepID=B9GB25_ORYSJ|nr:hypothetical protein OsJ_34160 [Oryza sativa Japonica Group]